jgi:DNA repair ATPase RecN
MLSDDTRVEEIARMTGGASMTDASRALAEELLNERFKRQTADG